MITLTKEEICKQCLEGTEMPDCPLDEPCKVVVEELYCHQCGNIHLVYEGPAEGYWCPKCGSSDQDE